MQSNVLQVWCLSLTVQQQQQHSSISYKILRNFNGKIITMHTLEYILLAPRQVQYMSLVCYEDTSPSLCSCLRRQDLFLSNDMER